MSQNLSLYELDYAMWIDQPILSFEIVYKAEDLIQVKVIASNGKFAGITAFYSDVDGKKLIEFAEKLRGFPKEIGQVVDQEFGFTRKERFLQKGSKIE